MEKKIPQRRCVGCMTSFDKSALIKIVKTPDANVIIDEAGNMQGRSVYICKNKNCVNRALKGGKLSKSLKCEIAPDIYSNLERMANQYE